MHPEDRCIQIREVFLLVSDDAELPMPLGDDLSLQFVMRTPVLGKSRLRLVEQGAPEAGRIYLVHLADFCSAR